MTLEVFIFVITNSRFFTFDQEISGFVKKLKYVSSTLVTKHRHLFIVIKKYVEIKWKDFKIMYLLVRLFGAIFFALGEENN